MLLKEYHIVNGVEMLTTTIVPAFTEPIIAGPDEAIPPEAKPVPDETNGEV